MISALRIYIFSHCACSFNWYQGATAKPGKTCGSVASITYEMRHRKPDKEGNPYPTLEQCYITVTKTANSNQEWTNRFDAVVADVADVLRAAARTEAAAAAVALSSRKKSFRACFAAFLFLMWKLEKSNMLLGRGGHRRILLCVTMTRAVAEKLRAIMILLSHQTQHRGLARDFLSL